MNRTKSPRLSSKLAVLIGLPISFLLWMPSVDAATYYVATSGSDARDCATAQNIASPMLTIQRGMGCLAPGDTLDVRAGTYQIANGSGQRTTPALNPPSGTAGRVVTIKAHTGENVTITYTAGGGLGGPLIGTEGRSYVTWDGFTIAEVAVRNILDTGPVVVWSSQNITFKNLNIQGANVTAMDNHNALRCEDSANVTIANNRIHDTQGVITNHSLIQGYSCQTVLIEHNEFYNSLTGVFPKGPTVAGGIGNPDWTIRYNLFHNIANPLVVLHATNTRFYQNIIYDGQDWGTGFSSCLYSHQYATSIYYYNNTIYNTSRCLYSYLNDGQSDHHFYNNLISANPSPIFTEAPLPWLVQSNYNDFYGMTNIVANNASYSLSSWRSTTGFDLNTISANPLFVNPTAHDFHLQSGSPAINAGRVGGVSGGTPVNMGAYITGTEVIGPIP